MSLRELLQQLDRRVLWLTGALAALSVLLLASVAQNETALKSYPLRQTVWLVFASGAFLVALVPHYRGIVRHAGWIYLAALLLLLLVDRMGVTSNNARRWLPLFGGFGIQPSEFMKVAVVLFLARSLAYLPEDRQGTRVLAALLAAAIPMLLIVRQPDLGTALLFPPALFAMLYVGGVSRRILLVLVLLGLAAAPAVLWKGMHGYQRSRVEIYLRQASMTEEMKRGEGYQLHHAKLAVGGGGPFGHGFANGPENRGGTLPARHTDTIFAVLAEEWGFLGVAFILAIYGVLFRILAGHAVLVREPTGRLLVTGALALLGAEVIVNLAMCVGLLPIVGITLPFVSAGGSSLLSSALLLGLALNAATRKEFAFEPAAER